ncbi:MAG TPA: hypothetical protein VLA62_11095, partial [Solirubrobacterales bacterium]|nr:hypothetical protein [Solirubrobacterales bacterium]
MGRATTTGARPDRASLPNPWRVTHLADRVVVYDQGRVLEAARTAELFARPSSARVAELLGLRNL